MLKAAKSCLDSLITKENYPIEFGYSNSDDMGCMDGGFRNGRFRSSMS